MADINDKLKAEDEYFGTPLGAELTMPSSFEVGDIILGRVSKVDEEFVYVSTGHKSEARIPVAEFKYDFEAGKKWNVDDEIEVVIDRISGEELFLSYTKVVESRRWDELEKKFEENEPVEGKITLMVKGGYRMELGVSRLAFVPGSHVGIQTQDPVEIVGMVLPVLIIEFNRETGNIVVSHRELAKRIRQEKEDEVFGSIQPNTIVEGKVTRLTNFGAFIDIGGIEGLVHVSELAWSRVNHPSQVLNCGDVISVKILSVNMETKKISLSYKHACADPWDSIYDYFRPDTIVTGTVSKIMNFGLFINLSKGFEGLLHISEVQAAEADEKKKFKIDDELKVKIVSIDQGQRRIRLGLVVDNPADVQDGMQHYLSSSPSTGGISIGDMLQNAMDKKSEDS